MAAVCENVSLEDTISHATWTKILKLCPDKGCDVCMFIAIYCNTFFDNLIVIGLRSKNTSVEDIELNVIHTVRI